VSCKALPTLENPRGLSITARNPPARIRRNAGGRIATPLKPRPAEANTYLHHIAANYDRLARRTLFLQGDPFAHRVLPIPDYFADPRPFACGRLYDFFIESVPWWTAAGQEINAGVMREFLEIIECDPNLRRFEFTAGAQFALPREVILRRPRSYYQRLAAFTAHESVRIAGRRFDDRHVAFLFEIFWRNVFQLDESTDPSIPG
jgi:hypothetical protein